MKAISRILIFSLFIACATLSAMEEFKSGYYITLDGDTVRGEIAFQRISKRSEWCPFRHSEDDTIQFLLPHKIRGYRYIDGRYYVAKKVVSGGRDRLIFIEYLVEGQMSVFLHKDTTGNHFYICRSDGPLIEVPYAEGTKYVVNKNAHFHWDSEGDTYSFRTRNHILILEKQLSDQPKLKSRIRHMKVLNRHGIVSLIKDYNKMQSNSVACIVYKAKGPSLRATPEPVCGFAWFVNTKRSSLVAGAVCSFSFPNSDFETQMKSGFLIYRMLDQGADQLVYKIPLQIQYPFYFNKTQFRIIWGANFITNGSHILEGVGTMYDISAGGELLFETHKNVRFFTGAEIETKPLLASPFLLKTSSGDFILSISAHAGLSFQF